MERDDRYHRDDVDPAEALGGAGALPMPEGQPRGVVPTDRDAPRREAAPETVEDRGEDPEQPSDG
jgi:hypothetical protein